MVDVANGNDRIEKLSKLSKRQEKLLERKEELEQKKENGISAEEHQRILDKIKKTDIALKNIRHQIEKRLH